MRRRALCCSSYKSGSSNRGERLRLRPWPTPRTPWHIVGATRFPPKRAPSAAPYLLAAACCWQAMPTVVRASKVPGSAVKPPALTVCRTLVESRRFACGESVKRTCHPRPAPPAAGLSHGARSGPACGRKCATAPTVAGATDRPSRRVHVPSCVARPRHCVTRHRRGPSWLRPPPPRCQPAQRPTRARLRPSVR